MDASAKIYSPKELQQTLASALRSEELSVGHGQDCVIVTRALCETPWICRYYLIVR